MKKFVSLLLVMVLALSLTVLPVSAESKGVIKLGGLAPLTGNYAEYGKGFQIGWQMAIDEINAGGANGYMLEIDVKDTQGDTVAPPPWLPLSLRMMKLLAILGDFTSGACKANASIVDRYGIVQLSPTASAPDYAAMSPSAFPLWAGRTAKLPTQPHMCLRNT